jgi:gas vesicle protein
MAHSHSVADNKGQLAAVVGVAALVGALTGMLFAPRSGSGTRSALKRRSVYMKDKMQARRQAMMNKAEDKVDDAQQSLVETTDKAKHKIDQAADKAKGSQVDHDHIRRHGEP